MGLALALLAPTAAVGATPDISFSGSGWGHGVGLSQYGAKAMGADGATYRQILDRYYTDISIGPASSVASGTFLATDSDPLWVGLLQQSSSVSFSAESGAAQLCFDNEDYCVATAATAETWHFGPDGSDGCSFRKEIARGASLLIASSSSCSASVRPVGPSTVIAVPFKARSYRNGIVRFRQAPEAGTVHTILEIGIDDYTRGLAVVPES